VGGAAHLDAGILDAVGADETGASFREAGNAYQDAASYFLGEAGKELGEAKDDVFGP
jgi:hypothetical protein